MGNDCSLNFDEGKIPLNVDINSEKPRESLGEIRKYIEKTTKATGTTGPRIEAYDMHLGDPELERKKFGIACHGYPLGCEGCIFYKTLEKVDVLRDIPVDVESLPISL